MAIIEICDICGKKIDIKNGIALKCSDMNRLGFIGTQPVKARRDYEVRICDKCINSIKSCCKKFSNK